MSLGVGFPTCSLCKLTYQARKRDALLSSAPPNDPAWNAQLEKERQDEIQIISEACEAMGREIYEVRSWCYRTGTEAHDRLHRMDIVCSTPSRTSCVQWA